MRFFSTIREKGFHKNFLRTKFTMAELNIIPSRILLMSFILNVSFVQKENDEIRNKTSRNKFMKMSLQYTTGAAAKKV